MKKIGVILAGGKGERLWPWSRANRPKQLLSVASDVSLVEQTAKRIKDSNIDEIFVLTTYELKDKFDNLKKNYKAKIFVEPRGKNTLTAIAYMSAIIKRGYDDAIMVVLPADHIITETDKFKSFMEEGIESALKGNLVTFGIVPTRPDTNYGYIEMGEKIGKHLYKVDSFREKPGYKDAADYLKSGRFLWNAGIFVWKVSSILHEISLYQQELLTLCNRIIDSPEDQLENFVVELYDKSVATSIDYGIMEYSENVTVVKSDFMWDDVGSWLSLKRHYKKDDKGNVKIGNVLTKDGKENIVYSEGDGLFVLVGVSDVVAVRTKDVTFVCSIDKIQNIKDILTEIKEKEEWKKFI